MNDFKVEGLTGNESFQQFEEQRLNSLDNVKVEPMENSAIERGQRELAQGADNQQYLAEETRQMTTVLELYSHEVNFAGLVVDIDTGLPIEGATVSVEYRFGEDMVRVMRGEPAAKQTFQVLSDSAGRVSFSGFKTAEVMITVTKNGWKKVTGGDSGDARSSFRRICFSIYPNTQQMSIPFGLRRDVVEK